MNNVEWLQDWYLAQCNGDWEHGFGISITTLDNPGWALTIHLTGTAYQDLSFAPVERKGEQDWMVCRVNGKTFEGFGGAGNLDEVLEVFKTWTTTLGARR